MLIVGSPTVARNTIPKALISQATLVDMPNVRAWGDTYSAVLQRSLVSPSIKHGPSTPAVSSMPPATSTSWHCPEAGPMAPSALAADGWTAAGTRPVFKLVTGISTGA